jgi:hypothetical protein
MLLARLRRTRIAAAIRAAARGRILRDFTSA